jgi:excisionase family DNA binding protein
VRNISRPLNDGPRAFVVKDACERLSIGRSHLYALAKKGTLRIVKIGGRTVVPSTEIDRLLSTGE